MLFFHLTVFLFTSLFSDGKTEVEDPVVHLPNGIIRGRKATTLEDKSFYAFYGIPYAAPPLGNLRFQAPQPALDWDGIRDGTQIKTTCFQILINDDTESEDCLFINVFTPQLPSEDKNVSLPVMLYIHGGGFIFGNGMLWPPDLFINNDVVFASINYRVGIFGFLSTQDEVIPGNNGLKDQQFAIQWAHNHIHLFGGNPDQITIFGNSAGSASVAYQMLNHKNDGLFQSAILQSGSFLSPWAFQRRAREIAFSTGSLLNSTFQNSDDSQALLDFLMTLDARDIDVTTDKFHAMATAPQNVEVLQGYYFSPVVEVENPNAFMTKKMYDLLETGDVIKVPILIGITSEEDLMFNPDPNAFHKILSIYDEHLDYLVPNDMGITDETERTAMGESIRDLYTGGEPLADHLGDAIRYCSDTSFTRSVIKHAEIFSKFADTYFYMFSYDGEIVGFNIHYDGAEAVTHCEELKYLFCSGARCDDSSFPENDGVTRKRLIKLWTDFAKFKNPTPETSELLQNVTWPVVSTDDGDFLYLDINENLEIRNHPKQETYEGWNRLYDSLGHKNFDTY